MLFNTNEVQVRPCQAHEQCTYQIIYLLVHFADSSRAPVPQDALRLCSIDAWVGAGIWSVLAPTLAPANMSAHPVSQRPSRHVSTCSQKVQFLQPLLYYLGSACAQNMPTAAVNPILQGTCVFTATICTQHLLAVGKQGQAQVGCSWRQVLQLLLGIGDRCWRQLLNGCTGCKQTGACTETGQ